MSEDTVTRSAGAGPEVSAQEPRRSTLLRLRERLSGLTVFLVFVLAVVWFASQSPTFLTVDNVRIILLQSSVLGVAAVGATMALIGGRLDISQGAVISVIGVLVATFSAGGMNPYLAIAISLAAGAALGAVNGLLSEAFVIPAFIATLGTALILRGAAQVYTQGQSVALGSEGAEVWRALGLGRVGPVPVSVVIMVIVFGVAWFVMRRTAWGMRTYAVGSSARASRVAGVRVRRHRIQLFVAAGALSALAGVLLAARLGSGAPNNGQGAEFDIFAAVVLGGTSLFGGRGGIPRTFLGIVFLATLSNGLVITNVSSFYQGIVTGTVLLGALALDRLRARSVNDDE